SLLPKAAFLVASIPAAVLGGAGIAMFGMVAATGIKLLQEADIGDRRNQLLVAVSIGLGMVPVIRPECFAQLPHWMEPTTHRGDHPRRAAEPAVRRPGLGRSRRDGGRPAALAAPRDSPRSAPSGCRRDSSHERIVRN